MIELKYRQANLSIKILEWAVNKTVYEPKWSLWFSYCKANAWFWCSFFEEGQLWSVFTTIEKRKEFCSHSKCILYFPILGEDGESLLSCLNIYLCFSLILHLDPSVGKLYATISSPIIDVVTCLIMSLGLAAACSFVLVNSIRAT